MYKRSFIAPVLIVNKRRLQVLLAYLRVAGPQAEVQRRDIDQGIASCSIMEQNVTRYPQSWLAIEKMRWSELEV
jgi:hypothetical protein